mgnify:CR=1 FL=1
MRYFLNHIGHRKHRNTHRKIYVLTYAPMFLCGSIVKIKFKKQNKKQ